VLTAENYRLSPPETRLGARHARTAGPTAARDAARSAVENATCPATPKAGGHAERATPAMLSRDAPAASAGASAPSGSPRQAKTPIYATAATGDR